MDKSPKDITIHAARGHGCGSIKLLLNGHCHPQGLRHIAVPNKIQALPDIFARWRFATKALHAHFKVEDLSAE